MKTTVKNNSIITAHAEADDILRRLREATAVVRAIDAEFAAEVEILKQLYDMKIAAAKQTLAVLESDLESFSKTNKAELFAKEDTRLELQNGALTYTVERRVKRIRNMLNRLEQARRTELVKIAKSVDWDAVDKLDDADLKALGTKRVPKDRFSYELKFNCTWY